MGRLSRVAFNRYPNDELENLKEQIAGNFSLQKENVLIGNGSSEILEKLFYCFGGRSKKIVYPQPSFSMLAYMNEESLQKTLETGYTWFFSRSRQKLWQKGETSGNVQKVKEISYDCDGDTLLVRVHQSGVACHTGSYSCFSGRRLGENTKGVAVIPEAPKVSLAKVLNELYNVIQDRRLNPVEGSYTNYLFEKGQDKILKKVGEEAVETVIASKNMPKIRSATALME